MRRHWQLVGLRREWPALARHAELAFDLLIVRPQIVVTDWPIRTHAFGGERSEILAKESRHDVYKFLAQYLTPERPVKANHALMR